jgi:hypothetical protein
METPAWVSPAFSAGCVLGVKRSPLVLMRVMSRSVGVGTKLDDVLAEAAPRKTT